jgi:thiol:disulfide interchange protein DsbG
MNKKLKVLSLSLLTSLSLMSGFAKAATNSADLKAANTIIQNMTKGSVKAEKTFDGPEKNIVGVLFNDNQGHQTIGWLIDNKYIAGAIFNQKGENLTIEQAQKMGLIKKPIPENILLEKALKAPGFKIGNKGPLMLAFEDPNCIFCHKLSDNIERYVESGQIQLKIIPVAFLKEDSMNKAMAIMEAKNPAEAWKTNQKNFNIQKEEGGITNIPIVKNQTYLNIQSNTSLLAATGNKATPTLLVCVHGQKTPLVLFGVDTKKLPELIKDATTINQDGSCAN